MINVQFHLGCFHSIATCRLPVHVDGPFGAHLQHILPIPSAYQPEQNTLNSSKRLETALLHFFLLLKRFQTPKLAAAEKFLHRSPTYSSLLAAGSLATLLTWDFFALSVFFVMPRRLKPARALGGSTLLAIWRRSSSLN